MEALPEVIVVLIRIHVVAAVTIIGILIGVRTTVIVAPMILPIGTACVIAFPVAIVHGLAEHVGSVAVDFVVAAAAIVTIAWRRVEIRVAVVIVMLVLECKLLLTLPFQVLLLEPILRHPVLSLQLRDLLLRNRLLLLLAFPVGRNALLLLGDQLLLLRRRQAPLLAWRRRKRRQRNGVWCNWLRDNRLLGVLLPESLLL